jgi:hypothetical protein
LLADGRVTTSGRDELEGERVEWLGQDDGFAAQPQPNLVVLDGLDVVDGEAADRGRPLGVEQHEQPGHPVFGLERVVVEQPAGLVPAGLGVDDASRTGPFDGREVEAGQLLVMGPADEVSGFAAQDGLLAGKPGVQIALAGGGQGEVAGGEPVEQGNGGLDVLVDDDGLTVGGLGAGDAVAASSGRSCTTPDTNSRCAAPARSPRPTQPSKPNQRDLLREGSCT